MNDLLDDLAAQIPDTIRGDDVTVTRLMERRAKQGRPITRHTAQSFLNQQVEAGLLVKVEVVHGRGRKVYRRPLTQKQTT